MTEIFKKYGKVEHVVLSCDMRSGSSSDIGYIHYTTREAAMLCVESFDGQELAENESKVASCTLVRLKFFVYIILTFLVVHARCILKSLWLNLTERASKIKITNSVCCYSFKNIFLIHDYLFHYTLFIIICSKHSNHITGIILIVLSTICPV